MPKRSNHPRGTKFTEKKARKKPKRKPQVIHPVNRQHQYHAVHNSALRNSTRDTAHAKKIKEVIKEKGTSLSDARLDDLAEKYKELIKGEL